MPDPTLVMDEETKWFLGVAAIFGGVVFTAIVSTVSWLHTKIEKSIADTNRRLDDVRNSYVLTSELERHMSRIDATLHDIKTDIREQHKALQSHLDALLPARDKKPGTATPTSSSPTAQRAAPVPYWAPRVSARRRAGLG